MPLYFAILSESNIFCSISAERMRRRKAFAQWQLGCLGPTNTSRFIKNIGAYQKIQLSHFETKNAEKRRRLICPEEFRVPTQKFGVAAYVALVSCPLHK